jgi:HEAT repeat protein
VLKLGLADPDLNVRVAAVEYLGERGRPELKDYFEALVQCESDAMLLSAALSALEAVGDEATYEAIEARFAHDAVPAFLAPLVLKVMAKCGPVSCLARLFEAQALLGQANLAEWIDALQTFQVRHALRIIPEPFFAVVCELAVSDTSPVNLFRLLKWIGCLDQQTGVVEFLTTRLRSVITMARHGAALGLCRIGTPDARAALAAMLPLETDPEVRAAMLCAGVEGPRP